MNIKNTKMYKDYFTKEGWSDLYDVWKIKQWHLYIAMGAAEIAGIGGITIIYALCPLPPTVNLLCVGIVTLVVGLILLGIWSWVHTRLNWVEKDGHGHKVPLAEGKIQL